jgi:hypothetical protein
MRNRLILLVAVSVLVLAGCASPVAKPSPAQSPKSNSAACTGFESVTSDLAQRIVAGSDASNADEFKQVMGEMPARFDEAALKGTGDVKSRIETLIQELPDPPTLLFLDSANYFKNVEAVQRACKAAGAPISPSEWK